MAIVAPIRMASSRRNGFGSLTTMWRAPAWRATAVAMRPIGPAPLMSTSSPRTGNASAVWTALPNGSKIAATSSSMPGQWCQMFVIGRATNSAKAPSRPTPEADGLGAQVPPPGQAMAAATADDVTFAADEVARREVLDVGADLDDLADELVADESGGWIVVLGPGVPRLDVQVGAADAGLAGRARGRR